MRIALYCDELTEWQGGRDFFRRLFESLKLGCAPEDEITIVSLARDLLPWRVLRIGKHLLTKFPYDFGWIAREIRRVPQEKLVREIIGDGVRLALLKGTGSHPKYSQTLRDFDVTGPFLSPPDWLGDRPWVGHIPDCQHKRLPHFFSPEERAARDSRFAKLLQAARVVIVHSLDVKADLMAYFGPVRAEIIPLPFVASADPKWFEPDATKVLEKYRLPKAFFLCSNQFWQHKNHHVILEALAIARAQGRQLSVVFTGEMQDYRNANHIQSLMTRVKDFGISTRCHFLGLIPKLDQISIMRSAVAIIQPTLFEGAPGGLAVSDAVGVGRPVIVSDIPVNREIQQYVDEYFQPTDARALFSAMCRAGENARPMMAKEQLLAEGLERNRCFGKVLRSAFAMAVEKSRSVSTPPRTEVPRG